MANNARRPGGVSRPKGKKGPTKGSGGKGRRSLSGKGPTPKAEDRVYHAAHKRKAEKERARKEAARKAGVGPVNYNIDPESELIVGRNPVVEAARAKVPFKRVFVASGATSQDERVSAALQVASVSGARIVEVPRAEMDRIAQGLNHQGIAIEVSPYRYHDLGEITDRAARGGQAGLIVALDQVTDPHNLGAVLRSAGAFGAHGVVVPERRSAGVNATAWKVSAGAAARVPVAQVTNLVRALKDLKREGYFVVGLCGGSEHRLEGMNLAGEPLVLVTGSEGAGLSRLVRETCDLVVSIPISGEVESLNAAVATGISLYEVARQRGA